MVIGIGIKKGYQKEEFLLRVKDCLDNISRDHFIDNRMNNDDEPTKTYYFYWNGGKNPSYVLETPEHKEIFRADCTKIGVFGPSSYVFSNKDANISITRKISRTQKTYFDISDERINFLLISDLCFNIDNDNNWYFLKKLDYTVKPTYGFEKLIFNLLHNDEQVASFEEEDPDRIKNISEFSSGSRLPVSGLYSVYCRESDLEAMFYACFCASRVYATKG